MNIEFQKSVVVGKVYQFACMECDKSYWNDPLRGMYWGTYVLTAETKKDMKVKVEEHIMEFHGGNK